MPLPRLLFVNEKTRRVSPECVIEDLKLDLILPREVTDYLLLAPERETLLKRREAFRLLLSDKASAERLGKVISAMELTEELYKAMTSALSEKTAAYVFVNLTVRLGELCEMTESLRPYGFLFGRFCDVFGAIYEKAGFAEALREARKLKKRLSEASVFVIRTDGEASVITAASEGGITDALRACAAELEIPLTERPSTEIILQRSVADALGAVCPEELTACADLLGRYRSLVTGEIFDYIPELKFVYGILMFTEQAAANGIPYAFPELCDTKKVDLRAVYDITLLKKEGTVIVPNDVSFTEAEPFFYLTGANGGGKTTYIRAVGGAMLLFLAGAPVFCEGGEASLLSGVYTHFPRDERFEGTGRFLDEKRRVDEILACHSGNAVILLNETFSTTGEDKAIEQTDILARTLYRSGSFGLYITHQHDVTENEIPFLGVTVDETDSNRRTYKIEKRRLPPRSFARDILEKYALDRASLEKRFGCPERKENR